MINQPVPPPQRTTPMSDKHQKGAVLLITLVMLALLLLSTGALIRSFQTSVSMAGNLAFKRDLTNQAERGIVQAVSLIKAGTLTTADLASSNYSASALPSNASGVPLALLNDTSFASKFKGADIEDKDLNIKIRYLIDRQCSTAGDVVITASCASIDVSSNREEPSHQAIYRISVRATGPLDSQVFLQSTVTR